MLTYCRDFQESAKPPPSESIIRKKNGREHRSRPSIQKSWLEVEAKSELHRPRSGIGNLPWKRSKAAGIAGVDQVTRGIAELVVVKEVGEDHLELGSNPLGDLEVLLHAQVDVPVRQATQNAEAAVMGIVAKDRLTDVVKCRNRVSEHVSAIQPAGADPVAADEVTRAVSVEGRDRDCVLRHPVPKEVRRSRLHQMPGRRH